MTRDRKTHLITAAVLALALAAALAPKLNFRSAPKPPPSPQDAIYAMLDAARNGNVSAYLASYTGPMEASLRQSLAETTEPAFAQYLRDSNAALKGVALSDPQSINDNEATVRVEYVYQERNEAQTMHLGKVNGLWRITRVDGTERVKTLVPYGTPVP